MDWALPSQIRQARETLGVALTLASERLGIFPEVLDSWERGLSRPDEEDLWNLGELYQRPTGYFFVETTRPPLHQDFRSERPIDETSDLALRTAAVARFEELCRVQRSLEVLLDVGERSLTISRLRTAARSLRGEGLAHLVRSELGLGDGPLKDVIALVEGIGVRTFVVDVDVPGFSGTAWWHPEFGPAILVNRKDGAARRWFTIGHELGHLLALSTQPLCGFLGAGARAERDANEFAAALLVPPNDLDRVVQELRTEELIAGWDTPDRALDRVARRYGVSREAASWRLEGVGALPDGFTSARRSVWVRSPRYGRTKGPRWRRRLDDLGRRHVTLARRAFEEGKISATALADGLLIGVEDAHELLESSQPQSV